MKAIFVIDGENGLRRIGRDIPYYDLSTVDIAVRASLPGYERIELDLRSIWAPVVFYVRSHYVAERHLIDVCRITGKVPEDHVYVVQQYDDSPFLFKTYESAEKEASRSGSIPYLVKVNK